MPIEKPTLTQISTLRDVLAGKEWIQMQFELDNLYSVLRTISRNQYSYIYALILNKKHIKLHEVLINIGLKPKDPK